MSKQECRQFEQKLAYHTAPSLLGIKCANLVSLRLDQFDVAEQSARFNRKAVSRGLKIRLMCRCQRCMLVLVYNEKLLSASLADPCRRRILARYGYAPEPDLQRDLDRLVQRMGQAVEFPHEIGIFLGYPTEDVEGFIAHKGEHYKLCGSWKVYGDPEQAQRSFRNYERCRKFLCNKLNQGVDIYRALQIS